MRELLVQVLGRQAARIPEGTSLAVLRGMAAGEMVASFKLTHKAAMTLVAAIELGRRSEQQPMERGQRMSNAAEVFRHFHGRLRDLKVEQFWSIHLDGKHRVQGEYMVSQGVLTSAPVHPREVFGPAIRHGAAAIVICHNHPSGDPCPSADDMAITERLVSVGVTVGIRIVDHVIIGDAAFVSLADRGLIGAQ